MSGTRWLADGRAAALTVCTRHLFARFIAGTRVGRVSPRRGKNYLGIRQLMTESRSAYPQVLPSPLRGRHGPNQIALPALKVTCFCKMCDPRGV